MNKYPINLISAVTLDGYIGNKGQMPWYIPEDLQFYKKTTTGNIIIVGRKTFEGLPSVALRNRTHIVITSKKIDAPDGTEVRAVNNIDEAIALANKLMDVSIELKEDRKIFVAGGGQIYESMIDMCDVCHITWINKLFGEMDTSFPIDKLFEMRITGDSNYITSKSEIKYKFTTYER